MMSITDPIELTHWHEFIIVVQGPEAWYDEDRALITFEDEDEAKAWVYASIGVIPQMRDSPTSGE
jgi:hypothetical protein